VAFTNGTGYDVFADFDASVRSSNNPVVMNSEFDSGVGLHPNELGYRTIINISPVEIFTGF